MKNTRLAFHAGHRRCPVVGGKNAAASRGFALDIDYAPTDEFRVVQLTPPGSGCSVQIGIGLTDAAPGSMRGVCAVVQDLEAVRAELLAH